MPNVATQATTRTFKVAQTRSNARTWANNFESRFLEAGIVSYEDNGCGKALLKKESIEQWAHTFIGRPLIIKHQRVEPSNMESHACGYITEVWFNAADGWFWCKGTCFDEKAKELIRQGQSVSCSYKVDRLGVGGEYHSIPYHEEILDFSGEHLAIVDNPRYEGATIRLNSKQPKQMSMFKWFRKQAVAPVKDNAGDVNKTKEVTKDNDAAAGAVYEDISPDTKIQLSDTESVTLGDLVTTHNAKKKNDDDGMEIGEEDEVIVNGKKVKFNELTKAYNDAEAKKLADEEAKKNDAAKKNDDDEEDKEGKKDNDDDTKDKKSDKKDNSTTVDTKGRNFRLILNAGAGTLPEAGVSHDSQQDRLARGNSRYGSPSK